MAMWGTTKPLPRPSSSRCFPSNTALAHYRMAKRKHTNTTVPPITGSFEDAIRAMLKTPPAPKNLGRPKAKKKRAKKST